MSAEHVISMEAAGVVEALGDGVSAVRPGDRVAYASDKPRTYSQATVMPDSAGSPRQRQRSGVRGMECHRVHVVLELLREQEQSRL
jgi:NADPH:quinone reductase-like Zn-dependent oxidoreductase